MSEEQPTPRKSPRIAPTTAAGASSVNTRKRDANKGENNEKESSTPGAKRASLTPVNTRAKTAQKVAENTVSLRSRRLSLNTDSKEKESPSARSSKRLGAKDTPKLKTDSGSSNSPAASTSTLTSGSRKRERSMDKTDTTVTSEEQSTPKRRRASRKTVDGETPNNNDFFCWICYEEGTVVCCELCPRVYHAKCLAMDREPPGEWVCPECEQLMRAECTDTRSAAMAMISVDQLCLLLKFALQRMKCQGSEPFQRPVDVSQHTDYAEYVFHPVDLSMLEKNIKKRMYGSTEAFLSDAKWILHNCIVFNGKHHKLTTVAKTIVKICKHEMNEIEICPDCYFNSCTKRGAHWFCEPCRIPHPLVWAKMRGYPFWPAKALRTVKDQVDCRFFGEHDRAWVPVSAVYLLSKDVPGGSKKTARGMDQSVNELEEHIRRIRTKFGSFEYAPVHTVYNPESKYVQTIIDKSKTMLETASEQEKDVELRITTDDISSKGKSSMKSLLSPKKVAEKPKSVASRTANAVKNKYSGLRAKSGDQTLLRRATCGDGALGGGSHGRRGSRDTPSSVVSESQSESDTEVASDSVAKSQTEARTPPVTGSSPTATEETSKEVPNQNLQSTKDSEVDNTSDPSQQVPMESESTASASKNNTDSEIPKLNIDKDSGEPKQMAESCSGAESDKVKQLDTSSANAPEPPAEPGQQDESNTSRKADTSQPQKGIADSTGGEKETTKIDDAKTQGPSVVADSSEKSADAAVSEQGGTSFVRKELFSPDASMENQSYGSQTSGVFVTSDVTLDAETRDSTVTSQLNLKTGGITEVKAKKADKNILSKIEEKVKKMAETEPEQSEEKTGKESEGKSEVTANETEPQDSQRKDSHSSLDDDKVKINVISTGDELEKQNPDNSTKLGTEGPANATETSTPCQGQGEQGQGQEGEAEARQPLTEVSPEKNPFLAKVVESCKEKLGISHDEELEGGEKGEVANVSSSSDEESDNEAGGKERDDDVMEVGSESEDSTSSDSDMEKLVIDEDARGMRTPRRATSPKTGKIVKRASPKVTTGEGGLKLSVGQLRMLARAGKIDQWKSELATSRDSSRANTPTADLTESPTASQTTRQAHTGKPTADLSESPTASQTPRQPHAGKPQQKDTSELAAEGLAAGDRDEADQSQTRVSDSAASTHRSPNKEKDKDSPAMDTRESATRSAGHAVGSDAQNRTRSPGEPDARRPARQATESGPAAAATQIDTEARLRKDLEECEEVARKSKDSASEDTNSTEKSHRNAQTAQSAATGKSGQETVGADSVATESTRHNPSQDEDPGVREGNAVLDPSTGIISHQSRELEVSSGVTLPVFSDVTKSLNISVTSYTNMIMSAVQESFSKMASEMVAVQSSEQMKRRFDLEIEKLKWRQVQELAEIKHNAAIQVAEIRNSVQEQKTKAVEHILDKAKSEKSSFEKQIEEAKKKQWCAKCGKEAIFYCCWNTSYCDYPCQQAHWPDHMSSCTQSQSSQRAPSQSNTGDSAPVNSEVRPGAVNVNSTGLSTIHYTPPGRPQTQPQSHAHLPAIGLQRSPGAQGQGEPPPILLMPSAQRPLHITPTSTFR